MFDIGFFEILVIAIVALVVIGPERMPETVRAVGLWVGRLKRSLRDTRNELERQIGADDIRRQLHNEDVMRSLEKTREQLEDAVQEGALPKAKTKPGRQYQKEEKLPDHAHGDSAPGDSVSPEPAPTGADEPQSATDANTAAEPPQHKSNS